MRRLFIPVLLLIVALWMATATDAHATSIQAQDPATIFARACASCHGAKGNGGVSWVKNSPQDRRTAPSMSGKSIDQIKQIVRNGSNNAAMPAFGVQEITDAELDALAAFIKNNACTMGMMGGMMQQSCGMPTPTKPGGTEVVLYALDADPWFTDQGADNAADPFDDKRRVVLQPGQYLKVVNTGRTWHTLTNAALGKDSGFIGYAGNYRMMTGDLNQGVSAGMGFYYADRTSGLSAGCNKYICKMHPYMTVEVCTAGSIPKGPNDAYGLTRAHKHPLGLPPVPGIGDEVWVSAQSQEEPGENTLTIQNKSVSGFDGAYQIINTAIWNVTRIPNVGNNPHNAWPGHTTTRDVVVSASWHDNKLSLIDANTKTLVKEFRSGASNAHVMVAPGPENRDTWFVTHMGGVATAKISAQLLEAGQNPNISLLRGASGPHGLWFCDDASHLIVADTFDNSVSMHDIDAGVVATTATGGKTPLATAIQNGLGTGGCARGVAGNAATADLSIYDISPAFGHEHLDRNTTWSADPADGVYKNAAGNLAVRVTDPETDMATPHPLLPAGETIEQKRWAHLTVQSPISPPDATTHGRFMVTANKASFNVVITGLDPVTGLPWGSFTIPAGLGAHGVTFGKKSQCDTNHDGVEDTSYPIAICYYAYVSNTFEDYVSVYDLEKIDLNNDRVNNNPSGVGMQNPGSALFAERLYLEGGAVKAVTTLDPGVASLCGSALDCDTRPTGGTYISNLPIGVLCPDCRSGVHVGDIPLTLTTGAPLAGPAGHVINTGSGSKYAYLKEPVWVDTMTLGCFFGVNDCDNTPFEPGEVGNLNTEVTLDLELGTNTGAQGILVRAAAAPWTP
ncbi:MAG TPA: c-type cytochrome [Patescibacteria group bacterium]|nr:c-type cytochrome [Patescibacteria group bacterium]